MPTGIPKSGINKGWFKKEHNVPKKWIERTRKANIGRPPWNKGKKGIMPIPWNKGKHLSKKTKNKIRKIIKKLWQNPEYRKKTKKRQTKIKGGGSYMIYMPTHPYANKRGYIIESRIIMEKYLGRYLKPKEVVHHINKNRLDNRIKNLQLFGNMAKHFWYHKKNL